MFAAAPATAAVLYTFSETGAFNGAISFTYTAASFIASAQDVTPDSCVTDNAAGCAPTQRFEPDPNSIGSGSDYIGASTSDGSTGFYFFTPGAFGAYGTYSTADATPPPGAGSAALGTLVVSFTGQAAVPEPATWATLVVGFGLLGGALRRRAALVAAG